MHWAKTVGTIVGAVALALVVAICFCRPPPAITVPATAQISDHPMNTGPRPASDSTAKTGTTWTGEPAVWTPVATAPAMAPATTPAIPPAPGEFKLEFLQHFQWEAARQGKRVTALCQDRRGRIWVGTEGDGLWCWDPQRVKAEDRQARNQRQLPANQPGWLRFTRHNTGGTEEHGATVAETEAGSQSLGDDFIYALACDQDGRIWAGHLNHGVSIFDGRSLVGLAETGPLPGWRNYDSTGGPLGERIFDIAIHPVTGDVWLATSAGLTGWSRAGNAWIVRQELSRIQAQALAFLATGTLLAGTACEGIASIDLAGAGAPPARPVITATSRHPAAGLMPSTPFGEGLPDNLINDLLVTRSGTVVAATCGGLAWSRDGGKRWTFQRGRDWEAKVRGRVKKPAAAELAAGLLQAQQRSGFLLAEDYCTSLAEDESGHLWVGHWQKGIDVLDGQEGRRLVLGTVEIVAEAEDQPEALATPAKAYVKTLLPACSQMLAGCYGEGVIVNHPPGTMAPPPCQLAAEPADPARPQPQIGNPQGGVAPSGTLAAVGYPWAAVLPDDWMTQGDWPGRYGQLAHILCAANEPMEEHSGYFMPGANRIGWFDDDIQDSPEGESRGMFRWCWELASQDRRALCLPALGIRRPAGWASTGSSANWKTEGTNCLFTLRLPGDGLYRLSLYFMNYDGADGANRIRDFHLAIYDDKVSLGAPPLAQGRVRDWQQGVYKRFIVKGPGTYKLRVRRNTSFNIMLNGVFLDRLTGPASAAEKARPGQPLPVPSQAAFGNDAWASQLVDGLPMLAAGYHRLPTPADQDWLRRQLPLWTEGDRRSCDATLAQARRQLPQPTPARQPGPSRAVSPAQDE
jgi:sugar lactone lactonase YvrE